MSSPHYFQLMLLHLFICGSFVYFVDAGDVSARSLPSWHPRHSGRRRQTWHQSRGSRSTSTNMVSDLPTYESNNLLLSPPDISQIGEEAAAPTVSWGPDLGTWVSCAQCDGCSISVDPPSLSSSKGQCSPCTGCSHELIPITGFQNFKGVDYKWEAGASSAHILRVNKTHPSNGLNPFVKFPCVPSTPKHGVTQCDLSKVNETSQALMALQHLAEDCGLSHISVDAYVAPIRSSMPDQPANPATPFIPGGGKVDQLGLFTTAAPGISISNLAFTNAKNHKLITQIKAEQVQDAALFDFLFCCSDRHAQNIFIDEDANLKLIDNDLMLGGSQKGRGGNDGSCTPSSLFLPSNMESWRVRQSPSKLGHLDYRCHSDSRDIPYQRNKKLSACVAKLADLSVAEIQRDYGIVKAKAAELLKQRSFDLREHGFAKALDLAYASEKKKFNAAENRPTGEALKHWHNNLWRPLEEPICQEKNL